MVEYLFVLLMDNIRIMMVCGGAFAIPAIRELTFFNQLIVVAVPGERNDIVEQLEAVLKGSDVVVLRLDMKIFSEQLREVIETHTINLGFIMTFSRIIPATVYTLPDKGFYNVHPGPLPSYRGPDPVFRQIINKAKYASISIHLLTEKFDEGPVVFEDRIKMESGDTHGILTSKLAQLAANSLHIIIRLLSYDRAVQSKKQNESRARYFKKQIADDVLINWDTMDAQSIIALINACNPWNKGAVAKINGLIIRLVDAEIIETETFENFVPGTIAAMDPNDIFIATLLRKIIKVRTIYCPEGFLRAGWLRNFNINKGDKFGVL